MRRKIFSVFAALALTLLLNGCAPELPERLLIRAIGVDPADQGWQITVRAFDFDRDTHTERSFIGNGDTVASAFAEIARQTGKLPLYSHSAVVVFGRECAENGLDQCLDFFIRHYDSYPGMYVLISDTTAEDVLHIRDEEDIVSTDDILSLQNAEKFSDSVTSADLITLINGTLGADKTAVVPIIKAEQTTELVGAGLLYDFKLIEEPTPATLSGMLLIKGNPISSETVFETPNCGIVSVTNANNTGAVRFVGTEASPKFEVSVTVDGKISSIDNDLRPLSSAAFAEIETAYAEDILNTVLTYLRSTVLENGMDAAGFGTALLKNEPEIWQSNEQDLRAFLMNAEYAVHVKAEIDRTEEEDTPYY